MAKAKSKKTTAAPSISSAHFTETRKIILAEGSSAESAGFQSACTHTVECGDRTIYIEDILFNKKSVKEILLRNLNTSAPFKSITIQYKAR
jgi:hypothetical protein